MSKSRERQPIIETANEGVDFYVQLDLASRGYEKIKAPFVVSVKSKSSKRVYDGCQFLGWKLQEGGEIILMGYDSKWRQEIERPISELPQDNPTIEDIKKLADPQARLENFDFNIPDSQNADSQEILPPAETGENKTLSIKELLGMGENSTNLEILNAFGHLNKKFTEKNKKKLTSEEQEKFSQVRGLLDSILEKARTTKETAIEIIRDLLRKEDVNQSKTPTKLELGSASDTLDEIPAMPSGPEAMAEKKEKPKFVAQQKTMGKSRTGNLEKDALYNEDAVFFDKEVGSAGVFDGLGGHYAAREASQFAQQYIQRKFSELPENLSKKEVKAQVRQIIIDASRELRKKARELVEKESANWKLKEPLKSQALEQALEIIDSGRRLPSTTAAVAKFYETREGDKSSMKVVVSGVGDSPVYIWRKKSGTLELITSLERSNTYTVDQCLGDDEKKLNPIVHVRGVEPGDKIIILSDGVYDNFSANSGGEKEDLEKARKKIESILRENHPDHAEALVQEAQKGWKKDDISAVVVEYQTQSSSALPETKIDDGESAETNQVEAFREVVNELITRVNEYLQEAKRVDNLDASRYFEYANTMLRYTWLDTETKNSKKYFNQYKKEGRARFKSFYTDLYIENEAKSFGLVLLNPSMPTRETEGPKPQESNENDLSKLRKQFNELLNESPKIDKSESGSSNAEDIYNAVEATDQDIEKERLASYQTRQEFNKKEKEFIIEEEISAAVDVRWVLLTDEEKKPFKGSGKRAWIEASAAKDAGEINKEEYIEAKAKQKYAEFLEAKRREQIEKGKIEFSKEVFYEMVRQRYMPEDATLKTEGWFSRTEKTIVPKMGGNGEGVVLSGGRREAKVMTNEECERWEELLQEDFEKRVENTLDERKKIYDGLPENRQPSAAEKTPAEEEIQERVMDAGRELIYNFFQQEKIKKGDNKKLAKELGRLIPKKLRPAFRKELAALLTVALRQETSIYNNKFAEGELERIKQEGVVETKPSDVRVEKESKEDFDLSNKADFGLYVGKQLEGINGDDTAENKKAYEDLVAGITSSTEIAQEYKQAEIEYIRQYEQKRQAAKEFVASETNEEGVINKEAIVKIISETLALTSEELDSIEISVEKMAVSIFAPKEVVKKMAEGNLPDWQKVMCFDLSKTNGKYKGLDFVVISSDLAFKRKADGVVVREGDLLEHEIKHVESRMRGVKSEDAQKEELSGEANSTEWQKKALVRAKDEILAMLFTRGPALLKLRFRELFLNPERKNYYYFGEKVSKKALDVFMPKYEEIISTSIEALNDLAVRGMSLESMYAELVDIPLSEWPKAVSEVLATPAKPEEVEEAIPFDFAHATTFGEVKELLSDQLGAVGNEKETATVAMTIDKVNKIERSMAELGDGRSIMLLLAKIKGVAELIRSVGKYPPGLRKALLGIYSQKLESLWPQLEKIQESIDELQDKLKKKKEELSERDVDTFNAINEIRETKDVVREGAEMDDVVEPKQRKKTAAQTQEEVPFAKEASKEEIKADEERKIKKIEAQLRKEEDLASIEMYWKRLPSSEYEKYLGKDYLESSPEDIATAKENLIADLDNVWKAKQEEFKRYGLDISREYFYSLIKGGHSPESLQLHRQGVYGFRKITGVDALKFSEKTEGYDSKMNLPVDEFTKDVKNVTGAIKKKLRKKAEEMLIPDAQEALNDEMEEDQEEKEDVVDEEDQDLKYPTDDFKALIDMLNEEQLPVAELAEDDVIESKKENEKQKVDDFNNQQLPTTELADDSSDSGPELTK